MEGVVCVQIYECPTNPTNVNMVREQNKVILPELSYNVMGALFEVSNEFGGGYQEKYYYRAVEKALAKRGLQVKAQVYFPLQFQDVKVGSYFVDFLIEDKIVLELKIGSRFRKVDFDQVKAYPKATKTPLGILARFNADGVTFHRVLSPYL